MPKLAENFSVKKAHYAQLCLSKKLILKDFLPKKLRSVAGIDVHYIREVGIGAVAVLDYESLNLLETQISINNAKMPYIPTLLSFREIAPALAAIKKLKVQPDVFLVDAQGLAHPFRCGFASHLGLALNKPSIGAAKSRLTGVPTELKERTFLLDKGEVIGEEVSTRMGAKPIYVSIGNMVSLETAVKIVKHCSKGRIPEPLRLAHKLATDKRSQILASKTNI